LPTSEVPDHRLTVEKTPVAEMVTTSGPDDVTGGGVALGDEVGPGDGEPTVDVATPEARGEEEGGLPVGAGWQLARKIARPSPTAGVRTLAPRMSGKRCWL
jgi:hypothetical protein